MISTPEQTIKAQYIALAKLLRTYRDKPLDKSTLQAILGYCKHLHALAHTQSNLVFAQPQLYKSQLPFIVNLAFNACVFTCLVATRNKSDPAVTIQLMCASISIYVCDQVEIEKYFQKALENKPLKRGPNTTQIRKLLQHHQQHIWLTAFTSSSIFHFRKARRIDQLPPVGALIYFANRLSILCTPNKLTKTLNFAQALKTLLLSSPAKFYSQLSPLLAYPGLTPPGAYIKDEKGVIRIVLAVYPDSLLTKQIITKQQNDVKDKSAELLLLNSEQLTKTFTSQTLKSFSRLNQWWNDELISWMASENNQKCAAAFHTLYPLNTAPPALLVIQDQLSQPNADISVLVKAIEREPSYAQQLQVSATLNNRQKQNVYNIKHGLAMLGTERTANIFLQHSLLSRLNQHAFPLQQTFLAFSQFYVLIVDELAVLTKVESIELVKTAAYFLLSRLFTVPALRTQLMWKTNSSHTFQVNSLINFALPEHVQNNDILLAQAWQQTPAIIRLLKVYDHPTSTKGVEAKSAYVLGLGLIMARQGYFTQTTLCEATEKYLNNALENLNMSKMALANLQKKMMIKAQISHQLP